MSDPVTNVEIEDVLSSIRRLVSEESRSETFRNRGRSPAGGREDRAGGRLVLTPALRVAEPADDTPETQTSEVEDVRITHPETPWEDPGATLYAAAAAVPQEIDEDETPEEEDDVALDAVPEPAEAEDVATEDVAGQSEGDEEALWLDDGHHDDGFSAEAFAEDLRQEDLGQEAEEEPVIKDLRVQEEVEALQEEDYEAAEILSEDIAAEDDFAEVEEEDRPLSERIQELEAQIARKDDQWEPDGAGMDDYAGTEVETLEWQDEEEPRPRSQSAGRTEQSRAAAEDEDVSSDDDIGVLTADETFLDEESLRELVADIVRQELQGALGERITRNVRKLVRREIHRALTAQDFE